MEVQRIPYGDGIYRRRIVLVGRSGGATGDLEDDFHHFRAHVEHDGQRVVRARGEALRFPWTSCPGALEPLRALEGMRLASEPMAAVEHTDPRAQCTHLFDVAALTVRHAALGRARLEYRVEVPDRRKAATRARLERDGEPLLSWDLQGHEIVSAGPFHGVRLLGREFMTWCRAQLEADELEAALVLRRACYISMGRLHDFDSMENPLEFMAMTAGSCHTFTPGIVETSQRVRGTTRDFTRDPERLFGDANE